MAILGYILLGFVPGLFWMWFYLRKDKDNPEPWSLIAKVFAFGIAITIPAIAFQFGIDYFFGFSESSDIWAIIFGALIVVAPIEEVLKYIVVREIVFRDPHFDEPVDGVMYAVVAALGFATLENILVVFAGGGSILLLRFATATLMHALASGIVGYHIGIAMLKPKKRKELIAQGLIVAIILHALYNIIVSLSSNLWLTLGLVGVLLFAMAVILSKGIEELKAVHKKRMPTFPNEEKRV